MNSYTIEDIEIIRRKSGISYEEAVNLLEYHNGNLAKALVDLERSGRIKPENEQQASHAHQSSEGKRKAKSFFNRLFCIRVLVKKDEAVIANLSLLFLLLALIISSDLLIVSLILILVLGYRLSIVRNSKDFKNNDLESMIKNAASNVRDSVSSIAKEFAGNDEDDDEPVQDSFYSSARSAEKKASAAAGNARPVKVDFPQDGEVQVTENNDGYSEATVR